MTGGGLIFTTVIIGTVFSYIDNTGMKSRDKLTLRTLLYLVCWF